MYKATSTRPVSTKRAGMAMSFKCRLTSAISGGAQSARRLPGEARGNRLQSVQAA
jgi:hypothetical protein